MDNIITNQAKLGVFFFLRKRPIQFIPPASSPKKEKVYCLLSLKFKVIVQVMVEVFVVRYEAVLDHFQHSTLQCGLTKTITTPHLIFAVACAVRCNVVWFRVFAAPHFCGHMCGAMYKIQFEVGMFFKFWVFPTQPKTNFFPFFFGKF